MSEKPKMKVRGLREYIELEHLEAMAAQALKSDTSKPDSTPFSIEGVWAGTKGDISFVVFPKKEEKKKEEVSEFIKPMSDEDARDFKKVYEKAEKDAVSVGVSRLYWKDFYLQDIKAVRLDIFDSVAAKKKVYSITVLDTTLYQTASRLADRYSLWKGKQEFIEKKKLEGLQELANKNGYGL